MSSVQSLDILRSAAVSAELHSKLDEASMIYDRVLELARQAYQSADEPELAALITEVAEFHSTRGHLERARDLYKEAIEHYKRLSGESSLCVAVLTIRLARVYDLMGNRCASVALKGEYERIIGKIA